MHGVAFCVGLNKKDGLEKKMAQKKLGDVEGVQKLANEAEKTAKNATKREKGQHSSNLLNVKIKSSN